MKPEVTVALPVRCAEKHIQANIQSLLAQSFRNLEIIVIEDPPHDRTKHVIDSFKDERIRYLRNPRRMGLSWSRNRALKLAVGKYVFFTDSDCVVSRDWIVQGLKSFEEFDCAGVEGRTYYVSESYKPTFSDRVVENVRGSQFMACNMAYRKDVLCGVGGFDERYNYFEDRDLALRVAKLGKIHFDPSMIAYHQKGTLNPKSLLKQAEKMKNRVLLYKRFRDKTYFLWRIAFPARLAAIIAPPLILGNLFMCRFETRDDFILVPFVYVRIIYERILFWQMCAKERFLLV